MTEARFIEKQALSSWLASMRKYRRVLVPQRRDGLTLFRPLDPGQDLDLDGLSSEPPKAALLPRDEALFAFRYRRNGDKPPRWGVELIETPPNEPTLVFGSRPCDACGFATTDRVYNAGTRRDAAYCARRDQTVVATLACSRPEPTCFCHRVGGGPDNEAGSDILVTEVAEGYLLEAVSSRGLDFMRESGLKDGAGLAAEAAAVRRAARAAMPDGPSLLEAPEHVRALFEDMAFWERTAAACLSCGACSYLCPTCYCFNITDEARGNGGIRLRSWDNCMSPQFTLEASGHNPRPGKAHRLRNRVSHKFAFYPSLHGGVLACAGCGRCIVSCPASLDIREIVSQAMTQTANAEGEPRHD
ncbi:MAG: hydrogenase [Desulfovibrio sp.]|nr:hydrogenase [Desulfovibrio sp.]